jgi:hypothetical protein
MFLSTIILLIIVSAVAAAVFYWRRAQRMVEESKAGAAWLNRELERTDSRIEAVEIWSDEQIERNDGQIGNAILERVGNGLSIDDSPEAKRLRAFLAKVQPTIAGTGLTAPQDLARAWFACLQILDKDPASELAQLFKVLNDAWTATREGQAKTSS